MREIKFRVWDKSNKIMYEKAMVGNFPDTVPVVWTDYGCREGWYHIEPKECEVMQYTGLKDKNGTEVYEGDVLKVYDDFFRNGLDDEYGIIKFDKGRFYLNTFKNYLNESWINFEVIGNIYENPELLEGN